VETGSVTREGVREPSARCTRSHVVPTILLF
jgi:hypothetical protein